MFERMLYLIDVTRDRLADASDETRDRLALAAGETREWMVDAGEGTRLRAAELAELGRGRLALVLGAVAAIVVAAFAIAAGAGGDAGMRTADAASADVAAPATEAPVIGPTLVQERGYSLSLPEDWVRSEAPKGAVFAAHSPDGAAQTTLWVERDPNLDFDGFVQQSLSGLSTLGDDARITDRVDGPTVESSSAELRADVALDGRPAGPYRVNLRAAGPYRYYLATSIQPGASPALLADAELIGSSLRPEVRLQGAPQ